MWGVAATVHIVTLQCRRGYERNHRQRRGNWDSAHFGIMEESKKMRILIADRDATSRQMISSVVMEMGHDVVIFSGQLQSIEGPASKGEAQIAFIDHAVP